MSKKQQQKLEIDSVTYLHSSNRSPSFMYSFANPLLYSRFSGLARGAQGDKVYFVKGRTNLREDRGLDIIGTVAAAASDRSDSQAPKGPALILIKTRQGKENVHTFSGATASSILLEEEWPFFFEYSIAVETSSTFD